MHVYKFLRADFALEDLDKRRLKISTFEDMNDPLELRGVTLSNRNVQGLLTSHVHSSYGALCFSRNWSNPMLWSHYGDKHKGICLGFDIGADVEVQEPFYVEDQQMLDAGILCDAAERGENLMESEAPFQASRKMVARILLTKSNAWRYEDEVRILVRLKEDQRDGDFYFAEFDENIQPSMVIAGPRCSVEKSRIKAAISGYSAPIKVVQAILSPNSFEVIEDTPPGASVKGGDASSTTASASQ